MNPHLSLTPASLIAWPDISFRPVNLHSVQPAWRLEGICRPAQRVRPLPAPKSTTAIHPGVGLILKNR